MFKRSTTLQPGFNFIELLISITIIAIFVGLAGPRVMSLLGKGKKKQQLKAHLKLLLLVLPNINLMLETIQTLLKISSENLKMLPTGKDLTLAKKMQAPLLSQLMHGDKIFNINLMTAVQNHHLNFIHLVIQIKKMTASHMQNKQSGISFIEILVTLLLISIATSFVIPRFLSNKPRSAQKKFFTEFSTLVSDTVFQAIMNKTVHQIYFDLNAHHIIVKKYNSKIEADNKHLKFEPLTQDIFQNQMKLPTTFSIQNFFIQNKDEFTPGMKMNDAWFYIMPDGNSQAVIINMNDNSDDRETKFSITVNPFYSQVKLHDTFQKP